MKKLTTTILGLSLLVGSATFAQDSFEIKNEAFSAFYPVEDVDSPSYLKDNESNKINVSYTILPKSSISDNALNAFYPEEDVDSPSYLNNNNEGGVSYTVLPKSSITIKHYMYYFGYDFYLVWFCIFV